LAARPESGYGNFAQQLADVPHKQLLAVSVYSSHYRLAIRQGTSVSETGGVSFTLAELIDHTADELRQARHAKRIEDGVMIFKSCELEIAVTVKAEASGGFRFWVIDASGKVAGETVSKIKLSFDANPRNLLVNREP
jgi:hypothetical protein